MTEYKLREEIINFIVDFIQTHKLPVTCLRVAGSMSYALQKDISASSDIDLDIFLDFSDLDQLNSLFKLLNCEDDFTHDISDFKSFGIISNYGNYKGVEINIWLINLDKVTEINTFKNNLYIKYYSTNKSEDQLKYYKVFKSEGTVKLNREYQEFRSGFSSKRYLVCNSELLSENYIINNLFIAYSVINPSYGEKVKKQMWQSFMTKYPDTNLQDIIDYMPEKVQKRLSDKFLNQLNKLLIDNQNEISTWQI